MESAEESDITMQIDEEECFQENAVVSVHADANG